MDPQTVPPPAIPTPEIARPAKAPRAGVLTALQTIISAAVVLATLFTLWTPANLFSNDLLDKMFLALQPGNGQQVPPGDWPTATPPPRPRIGIVSGHWGNDSGTVCSDGLTEEQVNLRIATQVEKNLKAAGYDVDLLQEKDPRLNQYQATALVSIHNDSCQYINNDATGYKVAAAMSSPYPEKASRLTACLTQRYADVTKMKFHFNTITPDMTSYHAFDEINKNTTAAIIETGFLNLDRDILVNQYEMVAQGVSDGILCYIRNESIPSQPVPTSEPTAEPIIQP